MSDLENFFPDISDEEKDKLYYYSLKKLADMAETQVDRERQPITGLYNLRAFQYKADNLTKEHPNQIFALLVLDIANFKSINTFCGRDAGDALLIHIADIFREYDSETTITSQFRADTFGIITPYESQQQMIDIAEHITSEIDRFQVNFKVLPACGICVASDPSVPSSLMRDYAMMALKTIKGKFYAKYAFFDDKMRVKMMNEKLIENEIIDALETNKLRAFIQPKIDMNTGKIIGGEALVRWIHPEKGIIPPNSFIPILENNGLIIDVDICVWRQVFSWLSERIKAGKEVFPISINISRVHAYDNSFREQLVKFSEEYNVPPELVPLELTESSFSERANDMYENMQYLKEKGFKLSMDDFGTGYSTMTMLKDQPVDEIKIDKGFINDINNPKEKIMVSSLIQMIKALDKTIVVEGVEDEQQQQFLVEQGCSAAQGFLFYKPMPLEEFEVLLDKN